MLFAPSLLGRRVGWWRVGFQPLGNQFIVALLERDTSCLCLSSNFTWYNGEITDKAGRYAPGQTYEWRWRESNPRPKNSVTDFYKLSRRLHLARGVVADHATLEPSRGEPKLPLKRPDRRRSAARRHFDARPPTYRREARADVAVFTARFVRQTGIRPLKERLPPRSEGRESKCWHFGNVLRCSRGQSAPACHL